MSTVVEDEVDSEPVVDEVVVEEVVVEEVAEVALEVVVEVVVLAVEVELRVVVEVDSINSAVVSIDSVISVVETSLSVVDDIVPVAGRSVIVVFKGYTAVEESLYVTYANTPRTSIDPRMRKIERHVGSIFFGFSLETCPSLEFFTG